MDILIGYKASQLLRLFGRHFSELPSSQYPKALMLATVALGRNSYYGFREKLRFGRAIRKTQVDENIVFVLGHWRSGTSHLHHLLSLDDRFTYPTVFDIYSPHSFLYTEPMLKAKMEAAKDKKRPMDNMRISYKNPGEDEFALAALSLYSPLIGWVFNRSSEHYDRYLTFDGATEKERQQWQKAFLLLCRKLTLRNPKPIMLKSPQHTARLGLLAKMFPKARFVHIHRHPFDVFNSTVKLYEKTIAKMSLTEQDDENMRKNIIARYVEMYNAYFRDIETVDKDRVIDIAYEALDESPRTTIKSVFEALRLGDFEEYAPKLDAYLEKTGPYKKNEYSPVQEPWRSQLIKKWAFAFKKWNYEYDNISAK